MKNIDKYGFETKAVHAGVEPDPSSGAIMTPIFQTSTYVQDAPGDHKGYEYARTQNPTRDALQSSLAALENGKYGLCFASGMAAMDTIMKLLRTGDEVIASNDLYGGSFRLLTKVYQQFGIQSKFLNLTQPDQLEAEITSKTKLIWLETPTNPVMQVIDISKIVSIAKAQGIMTCVDNTFASPYLQNPLDMGADLVHHSVTKYIAGHSDVVMGAIVTKNDELAERLYFLQNSAGAVPGPQDCFLTLRGIKTLHLRMDRSCANANEVAHFLENHPKVSHVNYPGLPSHPQHEIAKNQMLKFGGMLSFDLLDNSVESANKVLSNTEVFSLAESLGGVESLIGHPASMTHASIPREERLKTGLTDSLIRLSIGIESVDDLIKDLDWALTH